MKGGGSGGLHPTLPAPASKLAGDPVRKGAKDGASEALGLVKGGPPARNSPDEDNSRDPGLDEAESRMTTLGGAWALGGVPGAGIVSV